MPLVEVDLRGLPPGQAPARAEVAAATGADALLVRGPVPALAAVLTALWKAGRTAAVPVSWEPAGDRDSGALARALGLGSGPVRELGLVRDDHGGVLLHHGRIEAAGDGRRRPLARRLGAQAHHDAVKVADGPVTRIDVRPDWGAVDTLDVTVLTLPLRPGRRTSGRAVQVACDPARVVRDGVAHPRPVTRWTWYADDRVRWRLDP
ncbi:hypothetical protein [Geodermatophilus sp. DSM 44513]|uniref:hypothetical protein n=1 Tax=Geodermatophilus sp. DSM 44513 TaxID=1528104 RepID=UPI00127CA973|nr:hypothetical protein [Geodermatophilus sp. DSM 44513]WNV75339.1 hypothetical protein RTG05_20545 [Geodermatophilus sp. DSM 44513]